MSWHLKVRVANTESSVNTYSKYYISAITFNENKMLFSVYHQIPLSYKGFTVTCSCICRYISSQDAQRSTTQTLELTCSQRQEQTHESGQGNFLLLIHFYRCASRSIYSRREQLHPHQQLHRARSIPSPGGTMKLTCLISSSCQ